MVQEAYQILMDVGNVLFGAQQTSNAIDKVSKAFTDLTDVQNKYNKNGQVVQQTFKGIGSEGEKLSITLDKVRGKWLLAGSSASTAARDIELAQQAIARAMAVRSSAAAGRADTFIGSLTRGTDGSTKELFNQSKALAGLKAFVAENNVSTKLIQKMWADVSANAFKPFTGRLGELQAKLYSVKKAISEVGEETRRSGERSRGFLLSWESIARFFEARVLYNAVNNITGAIQQGTTAAIELSQTIGRIQTLAPSVSGDFDAWRASISRVSREFGVDAQDAAKSYYSALSNQIGNSIGEIEAFTRTTSEFARVTGSTAEQANNLFSSAINAFKLNAADSTAIAGKFFKAIDLGRITAQGLSGSFGRVAVAAQTIGVSLEETLAALSSLSRQGVTDADAMTQVLNVFNKLLSPTEKMKVLFKDWGVESGAAAIELFGFVGVLDKLNEEASRRGGIADLLDDFSDIRAKRGIAGILGDLKNFKRDLEAITNVEADYARARELTLTNGFKLAKQLNSLKVDFINFGNTIVNAVVPITENFLTLSEMIKVVTVAFAAAAGPAIVFGFSALVKKVYDLVKAFSILRAATLSTGIGIIAALAAGIATSIALMESNAERFERVYGETLDDLNRKNEQVFADIDKQSKQTMSAIDAAFSRAIRGITQTKSELNKVGDELDKIMEGYKKRIDDIAQADYAAISDKLSALRKELSDIEEFNTFLSDNIAKTQRDRSKQAFSDAIEELPAYKQARAYVTGANALVDEAQKALIAGNLEEAKLALSEIEDRTRAAQASTKEGARELISLEKELKALKKDQLTGDKEQLELSKRAGDLQRQITQQKQSKTKKGQTDEQLELINVRSVEALSKYNENSEKLIERGKRIKEIEQQISAIKNDSRGFDIQKELVALDERKLALLTEQQKKQEEIAARNEEIAAKLEKSQRQLKINYEEISKVFVASDAKNPFFGEGVKTKEEGVAKLQAAIDALYASRADAGLSLNEELQLTNFIAAARAKVNLELERRAAGEQERALIDQRKQLQDAAIEQSNRRKDAITRETEQLAKLKAEADAISRIKPATGFFGPIGSTGAKELFIQGEAAQKVKLEILGIADSIASGEAEAVTFKDRIKELTLALFEVYKGNDKLAPSATSVAEYDALIDVLNRIKATAKESGAEQDAVSKQKQLELAISEVNVAIRGLDADATSTYMSIVDGARAAASANEALARSAAAAIAAAQVAIENKPPDMITRAGGGMAYFAGGGRPYGSDKIHAMLSPGEFVMNAGASKKFYSQLVAMNSGNRNYAGGGSVNTNVGDIHISMASGGNANTDVARIGKLLRREIKRGTVKLH